MLHRGLTGHASHGKLKRLELNGACFTNETWNAVSNVVKKTEGVSIEQVMLTNFSFEQESFEEFLHFLVRKKIKNILKSLVLIHCKIPQIHLAAIDAIFKRFVRKIILLKELEIIFLEDLNHED